MILDILIPFRAEDTPEIQRSIEFIREILEGDPIIIPEHIIGITADPYAAHEASSIFQERLWALIEFSESNDQWIDQIVSCAKFAIKKKDNREELQFGVDLAILCALRQPELSSVLSLPWQFQAAEPLDESLFFHRGSFRSDARTYSVVACAAPQMGMISTALTATKVIEAFRPKVLVMTGICAGIPGRAQIGDVIFADLVWDWQAGKYITDADDRTHLAIAPHQLVPPHLLKVHIEQIRDDRDVLHKIAGEWVAEKRPAPSIVIGPLASGSAVIADTGIVDDIKLQQRAVCGIEMEGYGLFSAVHHSCKPQPMAMVLKSVCDFADPHKNDDHQSYASYTSAKVMQVFFERFANTLIK